MTKLSTTSVENIKAVIFDCDGTLVDSESIWMDMVKEALVSRGLASTGEALEAFRGITSTKAAEEIAVLTGEAHMRVQEVLDEEYSLRLRSVSVPMTSAPRFLSALKPLVPMAVASNGRREDVEALLKNAGLIEFIDEILTIEDVINGKPAPDLYKLACTRLGVTPGDSVVFEDSLIGITAAKKAGCRVIALGADSFTLKEVVHSAPGFDAMSIDTHDAAISIHLHTTEVAEDILQSG